MSELQRLSFHESVKARPKSEFIFNWRHGKSESPLSPSAKFNRYRFCFRRIPSDFLTKFRSQDPTIGKKLLRMQGEIVSRP